MAIASIDTILEAARLSPSGDNTQPVRFDVDYADRIIRLELDPARDPSPMNAAQRMARIAMGAALENMTQTAKLNQWQFEWRIESDALVFQLALDYPAGILNATIRDRVTNRKQYRPTELANDVCESLRHVTAPDDSCAVFVFSPNERMELCKLISEADSIILSSQPIRSSFLDKVRFDPLC